MISNKIDTWNTTSRIFKLEGVPQAQRHLLHALLYFAGRNNTAFPSMKTLSESTGIKERSLQGHMRSLIESGLITREMNAGPGGANIYRLTDKLTQPDGGSSTETGVESSEPGKPSQAKSETVSDPRKSCGAGDSAIDPPPQILPPRPRKSCHPVPAKSAPVTCKGTVNKTRVTRGLDSGLSWKTLDAQTVEQIVRADSDASRFRDWDSEGCRAFGWIDSEQGRLSRLCLWVASVRYARKHGGNAAALLVASLKGKRDVVVSQSDEDAARARLNKRPAPVIAPVMQLADAGFDDLPTKGEQFRALASIR